jgi:hypothetical protein
MRPRGVRYAVGAILLLVGRPLFAQDTEIRSVRVVVEPKASGSVTIENLRTSALEAWRIEVLAAAGSGQPLGIADWNHIGELEPIPGNGPIAPHERRTLRLTSARADANAEVRVTAAIFADGRYEGRSAAVEPLLWTKQHRSQDLAFWLDVLNKVPKGSDQKKTDYLLAKAVERAGQPNGDRMPGVSVAGTLKPRLSGDRPAGSVSLVIDEYKPRIKAALRDATRPLVPIAANAGPSLVVRTVPFDQPDYIVHVENLRDDASVEAWMVGLIWTPGGRTQPYLGNDACTVDPAVDSGRGSGGRIPPHQVRDIVVPGHASLAASQIQLMMVLFDDLAFEGSVQQRNQVLGQREHLAPEYGYWIEVFKEARALPATRVKAFLEAKRSEHAQTLAAAGAGPGLSAVNEAVSALDRSPQTFPDWLARKLTALEGVYARLTRHLSR